MTREEYLKQLIIEDAGTLKDFAKKINMPYTTLYSISRNVGGASIDNILKICKVLGISADDLAEMEGVEIIKLTLIYAYTGLRLNVYILSLKNCISKPNLSV